MTQWTAAPIRRAVLFSGVAIGLVGGWLALLAATWRGTATLHAVVATLEASVALFAGTVATLRYYTKRDDRFLFIGAGFLSVAILDGYQAAVAVAVMDPFAASEANAKIAWIWAASRLLLAAWLLASWSAGRRPIHPRVPRRRRDAGLWAMAALLCVGATVGVALVARPSAGGWTLAFPRSVEFLSAALFALALFGYSSRQRWQTDYFESSIIIALIISVSTQALYMARSTALFDAMFEAAHALTALSYAAVLVGLLADSYSTLRHVDRTANELSHQSSQRHQAEHDLQDERRKLRLALDAVKGGMWTWDVRTGRIVWDRRMHELFGLGPDQFGGTPGDWNVLIHPDDAARAERRRREALEGKRPYDDTYRVPSSSGKLRVLRDRGIVLRNADGQATQMVGHCVDVTETVRAAQDLTESDARFRSLADHAPVLIWMADKNRKITFFNRRWLEFTSRTLKQEQGEGWALGVHPDDRQRCMDAYELAFRERQPLTMEFRLRRHDGQYCWMLNTGVPRITEDGEFLGYVGSCVNITDLNEALQSLRITQFALDRAPDAVFWVRPDGRFAYVNDEACRALRYSAEELLELRVADVDVTIPAGRWPAFWARIQREVIVQFDTRIRRKDGSEFPAELTIGFLETPAGEIACAFARDVTERRSEQEALQASEERFELAIKGTREGLWDWTLATNAVWFSDRNAEMLGYNPAEWPHTLEQFNKLLHPDDAERTWEAVRQHFDTEVPYDVEFRLRAKDGGYRWIRSRGIAIRDDSGAPVRMVGSHQDIQDRKEAQLALEKSNEELRHFAYVASHDLQEPLRAITGFCGLVQEKYKGRLDSEADAWIGRAIDASQRLQSLVRDLLVYSRVESRCRPLESIDMNASFEIAVANLREAIHGANATVQSGPLPTVPGYPLQLVELLQNLIGNSIKYRAVGRPLEVRVSAERTEGQWVFTVCDNGLGIPPESHAKVFEMFRRLHEQDEVPGTGIGLAICQKVVGRHGGRIWIESDGTTGTAVKFTLPAVDDQKP